MDTLIKRINQYLPWQWLLAAIVVVLFACSQSIFFEKWNKWITPILTFDNGMLTSIMLIIPLIYPIYWLSQKINKGIFSPLSIFLAIVIISIYAYYRCLHPYAFSYICPGVAYADLYASILAVFLTESVYNFLKANIRVNIENPYMLEDQPIESENEDELNRGVFVDTILDEILKMNSQSGAHTFAIVAPWGSGKTSFINLLKEKLKKNRQGMYEVIDFCPWHLPDKVSLTDRFFSLLSSRVRLFNRELNSTLLNYASWLMGEEKNRAISKYFSNQSLDISYKELCKDLNTCGKRFIVIIDDIDRLEGKEILEVFKLMRGSANFPNVTFVVPFDKNYVLQALTEVSKAMNENYIKKFFQCEFFLPTYSEEHLHRLAIQCAGAFLNSSDLAEFEEYVTLRRDIDSRPLSVISPFITNLRELKRWLHVLQLDYKFLKGETVLTDMANLSLLKLYYPQIYQAICEDDRIYFIQESNRYILYEKSKEESHKDLLRAVWVHNRELLEEPVLLENMSEKQKTDLKELLERLFPKYGMCTPNKSISNYFYFKRYFYNTLQDYDIADEEFAKLLNSDEKEWKEYIDNHLEKKSVAFCKQVESYSYSNENELKKVLRIIFYAGSISNEAVRVSSDIIYVLLGQLQNTNVVDFIEQLFTENRASHFVCKIISFIKSKFVRNHWEEYINEAKKQEYLLKMLEDAVNDNLSTNDIYDFYCSTMISLGNDDYSDDQNALRILRQAYLNRPLEFFPSAIWEKHAHGSKSRFVFLFPLVKKMWNGNWMQFEKDFKRLDRNDILDEFYRFYEDWRKAGEEPIEFEFRHIYLNKSSLFPYILYVPNT